MSLSGRLLGILRKEESEDCPFSLDYDNNLASRIGFFGNRLLIDAIFPSFFNTFCCLTINNRTILAVRRVCSP